MQGELYTGSCLYQRCMDADSVCSSAAAGRNYKKGVYTAKAYEAAVSGSTEAVRRQGDGVTAARERLAGESGHYSVNGSKREITVNYEEYIKYPFAGLQWHIQGNAKSKVIRPVLFIEKVRSVKKWMGH